MIEYLTIGRFAAKLSVGLLEIVERLIAVDKQEYIEELLTGESLEAEKIDMHWFGFAVASLVLPHVENVLEIGTRRGDSTVVLSKLFSKATIYTVDIKNPKHLSINHPAYGKDLNQEIVSIGDREINLGRENIRVFRINSFFLPALDLPKQFELIFVDGTHSLPQVAGDIMFGYHSVGSGGFLFLHDHVSPCGGQYEVCKMVEWLAPHLEETIFVFPQFSRSSPQRTNRKIACIVKGGVGRYSHG